MKDMIRDQEPRDRTWMLPLFIASGPYAFLGTESPLLTILPIGPIVITWTLLSARMNGWNRTGIALGIGWLCAFVSVLINIVWYDPKPPVNPLGSWMAVPLAILLLAGAWKNNRNIGPAFKLVVIFATICFVGGFYETIYIRVFTPPDDVPGVIGNMRLGGLLVAKALYVPPHALLYSIALWYARRAAPDTIETGTTRSEEKNVA